MGASELKAAQTWREAEPDKRQNQTRGRTGWCCSALEAKLRSWHLQKRKDAAWAWVAEQWEQDANKAVRSGCTEHYLGTRGGSKEVLVQAQCCWWTAHLAAVEGFGLRKSENSRCETTPVHAFCYPGVLWWHRSELAKPVGSICLQESAAVKQAEKASLQVARDTATYGPQGAKRGVANSDVTCCTKRLWKAEDGKR